jgi:parallel beta-helix repeat protein
MKNRLISIGIVGLLIIGGFLGLFIVTDQVNAAGPIYVSGPITSDTTWYSTNSPYIVTGDVIVDNGTTLTIEADVTVKFDGLYSLIVNGTLIAIGTTNQPILFTSNQSIPAKGDWHRVRLHGKNNTMDYCEISYGNYPLYIMGNNTNNIISNCKVFDNTGDGIYLKETTNNTIYNATVSLSSSNGITLLISEYNIINASFISQNNAFGIYLRSSMNNTIESTNVSNNLGGGIELGLSSGNIQIKMVTVFENLDNGIDFNGNGFNNITDSQIIGNDGVGIDLGSASEHQRIENCIIRNNGGSGIDLDGSSYVDIIDCNISENKGNAGIYSGSEVMNITITNSEIWNNSEDGIEIYGTSYVNITYSNISRNALNGIAFNGSDIQENNIIKNCTIIRNGNNGIYFYANSKDSTSYLQNNIIYSNLIYSNTQNGIYFKTYTDYGRRYNSYIQYNNISNNTIYSNNRSGIYFYTYNEDNTYSPYIQYNCIYNNNIFSNNQNGIYFESFTDAWRINIQHNDIYNNNVYLNNQNGIYFYGNTWGENSLIQYNNIYNNTIYSNNQNGIILGTNPSNSLAYFGYNNIYSNIIYLNGQNGIYFNCYGGYYSSLQYNNIYSNTIYSNTKNGIHLYSYARSELLFKYNNIYSNTIYSNDQNGIYFYAYSDSSDPDRNTYFEYNNIYFNKIYSNNQNGMYIYGSSRNGHLYIQNNYIYSNTIYMHTTGCGIYAQSDNNNVTWQNSHFYKNTIISNLIGIKFLRIHSHIVYINNISNNINDGILLNSSTSNTFSYNMIAYNNWCAINLTYSSSNNKIQNNNITSNNLSGIFVKDNSNYNTITRNDILNHPGLGVNITNSFDNYMHHNNFKNNAQHAYDSTTQLNDWDDSVEGNWWDDYTGFDANGDGIGDIPYDVPGGGSKDWYPIINPANITAPHVENTTPEDGAVNVSVTPLISITFSNKMNYTATENAISISGGLTLKNFTWSNGDMTVTFEPSTTLGSFTTYTVDITISAKDVLENHLEETYQFSFTTKDVVAPTIILTSPAHNSIDIALNATIVVTFSEPMNITTVIFTCSPDPGGWSVFWSNMNSVATYTHADFGSLTAYIFEITGGKDIGGNDLVGGSIQNPWSFTTLDVVGPEITTASPSNGSSGVLLTANVVVTFSEQMNTSSVIYSCSPDPGGWVIDWTNGDKTVTYSHNVFTTQTIYTFHISAGKDMAGNDLNPSIPNPWSFTTIDAISPMITATSPLNNSINVQLNTNIIVTFNEPMDNTTVTHICNPNPGGWAVTWSGGNTVATYSHNSFSEKRNYIFQITGGKDVTGNNLVAGSVPNPWSFTTQDFTPPQIISTSPTNGSIDIMLNRNIVVTFSEAMDTSSLNYVCSPDPGGWSESWDDGNNVVTFSHNPFVIETTYTFQINTVKDISGNDLSPSTVPNPWSFATVGDIIAPQISSTSPANNEVNVDPDLNIQVIFNEAIDPSSLNYICTPNPGGWFESWSDGNTVVTLSHDPFAIGTTYTFYVTSGKDISGNDLSPGVVPNPWSFTTLRDLVAPQISSTSPADNEVNVDLNTLVTITFSEAMDTSTIDYICSPDPGGWFENWNIDNTVFTLLHNPFEIGTTYTFHITAGKDMAGNNLTSGAVPQFWNFTTISVGSLIVTPSEVSIPLKGTVVLIAQAYDSQNNPITDIIYTWNLNNNLGTISPQGTQAVTFKASSNVGICYVNVTAGGKSASAIVTIKSEDIGKDEPEDLIWISFLWLVIITACLVIITVVLWKKGVKTEEGLGPSESFTPEERADETLDLTQEPISEPHPPPPPPTDDLKQPPSTSK